MFHIIFLARWHATCFENAGIPAGCSTPRCLPRCGNVVCCGFGVDLHPAPPALIACRGVDCEEREMDYVKPADVAKSMVETGGRKLALSTRDLLIRGILSGAILGVATSLAFNGAFTTGQPLVGAIIFPVGLVMIVLLGLELVTGSFALVPLPFLRGEASGGAVVANWGWVFLGNLIGSVAYGALIAIALTDMGAIEPAGVAARLVAAAEAKTTGYAAFGFAGLVTVFIIPTGMMLGAKVTVADWWLWNQIPVTLGNVVGGFCFTGFALYWTYKPATTPATEQTPMPATVPAE